MRDKRETRYKDKGPKGYFVKKKNFLNYYMSLYLIFKTYD